jgi:alkylated DNA repair protein alkB family protein 1
MFASTAAMQSKAELDPLVEVEVAAAKDDGLSKWTVGGTVIHSGGGANVIGVDDEQEVFRSVWKFYKRNQNAIAEYVRSCEKNEHSVGKVPCLDFDHLHNSPNSLVGLVESVSTTSAPKQAQQDILVSKAYTIRGRPGFVFIPNPFVSADAEALWAAKLALTYPDGQDSQRNHLSNGVEARPLDLGLRWATLGFHYDWKARQYTEEARSAFPADLSDLSKSILDWISSDVVGSIEPETAIINYYRKGATMGGHPFPPVAMS